MSLELQAISKAGASAGSCSGCSLKIVSVVLCYNSYADVTRLVPQLCAQEGVEHSIIIVDNASESECVRQLKLWLQDYTSDNTVGSVEQITRHIKESAIKGGRYPSIYMVFTDENNGYSAGNNIGLRLSSLMEADAALVVNPDMRIENKHYAGLLSRLLFSKRNNFIVASRVVGLDGVDQNPQRESSLAEELFWPYFKLRNRLLKKNLVVEIAAQRSCIVEKVSGCCFMVSMDFIRSIDYLDENVFLYCEEPILSAQVRRLNGQIIYDPSVLAVHAHDSETKGDSVTAALRFIESRKYYIDKYSGRSFLARSLLHLSYKFMEIYYLAKRIF